MNDQAQRALDHLGDLHRLAAEIDRLRGANVALRQALVLIEQHARLDERILGFGEASRYSAIARDAINKNP